uniref:Uncharacterized protein n=1 Tax=Triticum urartu TaxID=4572 RepID=A0A8R7Q2S0_TRIUA
GRLAAVIIPGKLTASLVIFVVELDPHRTDSRLQLALKGRVAFVLLRYHTGAAKLLPTILFTDRRHELNCRGLRRRNDPDDGVLCDLADIALLALVVELFQLRRLSARLPQHPLS